MPSLNLIITQYFIEMIQIIWHLAYIINTEKKGEIQNALERWITKEKMPYNVEFSARECDKILYFYKTFYISIADKR